MTQSNMPLLSLAKAYWDRDLPQIPADVGLYRYHVSTISEYYSYVLDRLIGVEDAYFPFYAPLKTKEWPQEQKDAVVINRLFVDIDVKDGDTFTSVLEKAKFFGTRFWNNVDMFFSAGKGFHFYIYITPATYKELREYRDELYWNLATWLQYLHDKRVFISLDRICRITLTKHSVDPEHPTPVRWKIPVDPTLSLQEILRRSQYPENYVNEFYQLYQRKPTPIDWKVFLKSPHELL